MQLINVSFQHACWLARITRAGKSLLKNIIYFCSIIYIRIPLFKKRFKCKKRDHWRFLIISWPLKDTILNINLGSDFIKLNFNNKWKIRVHKFLFLKISFLQKKYLHKWICILETNQHATEARNYSYKKEEDDNLVELKHLASVLQKSRSALHHVFI